MSPVSTIIVSTRRVLVRRPWVQWVLIIAVATAIAASVQARLRQVDAQRDSWGSTRTVFVAAGSIEVGEPLRLERRGVPEALVPPGAIERADGTVARQRIGVGEIVTDVDVVADRGPRAMVPEGWLGVPVVESPRSGAQVGDRVQLVSDGFVVSTDAIVVGRLDDVTLLAVPGAEAPLVPAAATAGSLTLLLKP
jgi:hypothetical protein